MTLVGWLSTGSDWYRTGWIVMTFLQIHSKMNRTYFFSSNAQQVLQIKQQIPWFVHAL